MNTVWVTCDGEHPMDKEHIGPIKYYPRQGFPSYFYPFNNTQGYLSPIIAVHFMAPSRKRIELKTIYRMILIR